MDTRALTIVSANVWRRMDHPTTTRFLKRAMDLGTVVGMQELITDAERTHAKTVAKLMRYETWTPNENGYAWDPTRLKLLTSTTDMLHPAGEWHKARFVNSAFFRDLNTRKILCVMNTHLEPGAWTKRPQMRPLWERSVSVIGERFKANVHGTGADAVVCMGDFNGNIMAKTVEAAFIKALDAPYKFDVSAPTYGLSIYDYMFRNKNSDLGKIYGRVIPTASDHHVVMNRYKWKA